MDGQHGREMCAHEYGAGSNGESRDQTVRWMGIDDSAGILSQLHTVTNPRGGLGYGRWIWIEAVCILQNAVTRSAPSPRSPLTAPCHESGIQAADGESQKP